MSTSMSANVCSKQHQYPRLSRHRPIIRLYTNQQHFQDNVNPPPLFTSPQDHEQQETPVFYFVLQLSL